MKRKQKRSRAPNCDESERCANAIRRAHLAPPRTVVCASAACALALSLNLRAGCRAAALRVRQRTKSDTGTYAAHKRPENYRISAYTSGMQCVRAHTQCTSARVRECTVAFVYAWMNIYRCRASARAHRAPRTRTARAAAPPIPVTRTVTVRVSGRERGE